MFSRFFSLNKYSCSERKLEEFSSKPFLSFISVTEHWITVRQLFQFVQSDFLVEIRNSLRHPQLSESSSGLQNSKNFMRSSKNLMRTLNCLSNFASGYQIVCEFRFESAGAPHAVTARSGFNERESIAENKPALMLFLVWERKEPRETTGKQ